VPPPRVRGLRAREDDPAAPSERAAKASPAGGVDVMATGKIKWFNDQKGFGFIQDDSGGEDVFVHFSVVEMDGFKSLKEGQPVEYEAEKSAKGLKATKVKPGA
jgi:CspA family cold shock protein